MNAIISDGITTKNAIVTDTYFDENAGYCYAYIGGEPFYYDYFLYV
jgi:hypothetical protein